MTDAVWIHTDLILQVNLLHEADICIYLRVNAQKFPNSRCSPNSVECTYLFLSVSQSHSHVLPYSDPCPCQGRSSGHDEPIRSHQSARGSPTTTSPLAFHHEPAILREIYSTNHATVKDNRFRIVSASPTSASPDQKLKSLVQSSNSSAEG